MYIVRLVFAADSSTPGVPPALVTDIAWALADPADRVEHLHARSQRTRLELVVFMAAECQAEAKDVAHEFGKRILSTAPLLNRWHLREVESLHPDDGTAH